MCVKSLFGEGDLGFGRRGVSSRSRETKVGRKAVPQAGGSVAERAVEDFFCKRREEGVRA